MKTIFKNNFMLLKNKKHYQIFTTYPLLQEFDWNSKFWLRCRQIFSKDKFFFYLNVFPISNLKNFLSNF